MIAYTPKHFCLEQFIPLTMFDRLVKDNQLWKGWMLMDERILRSADQLLEKFGALTINNYHVGGSRYESGLRIKPMRTYKETSQHTYGRAIDCVSASLSGEDMRKYIMAHQDEFPYITRIEKGTPHLHVDVANSPRITLIDP